MIDPATTAEARQWLAAELIRLRNRQERRDQGLTEEQIFARRKVIGQVLHGVIIFA